MKSLKMGSITWDTNEIDEDYIDLCFFDSITMVVHKEDFDDVIKNLQDIHKEFLVVDSEKN